MRQDTVYIAVLLKQLRRALRPDAGHAGDVVRGIPDKCLVVGDLRRLEGVSFTNRLLVVHHGVGEAPAGREHAHVRTHELQYVRVARQNDHFPPLGDGLARKRTEEIIGFIAVGYDNWHGERFEQLEHLGELVTQPGWHGDTRGLVIPVPGVAERLCRCVEGRLEIAWLELGAHLYKHACEPEHRVDQLTARGSEIWQCVKSAVDERVPVDQN